MTPWCFFDFREMALVKVLRGDLAKRLLGVGVIKSPQHQRVFWPNPKSQILQLQVSFLGLNIALSPNLIGSSDVDFHRKLVLTQK